MIETKDLILKQGSADDWQDLYKNLWSRGEVFRYMFTKPSPTEEHAMKKTAAYAEMHKEVKTEFFVYDKATEQAIGIAGLKEIKPNVYTVTDIALCSDFHGKGYGKQILTAFISLAFDGLNATELHYDCFEQNEVSKHLALSCGFTYTHSEEAELTKNGENVVLAYYCKVKPKKPLFEQILNAQLRAGKPSDSSTTDSDELILVKDYPRSKTKADDYEIE